jgi:hypothetical protein
MKSDAPSESIEDAKIETLKWLWTAIADKEFGSSLISPLISPKEEGRVTPLSFDNPIHRKHIGSLAVICANYSCLGNLWWQTLLHTDNTVMIDILTKSFPALWEIANQWNLNKDDLSDVYGKYLQRLRSAQKSTEDDDFISNIDSIFEETLKEEESGPSDPTESVDTAARRIIAELESGQFSRYFGVATEIYEKIDLLRKTKDNLQETAKELVKTDPVVVLFTEFLSDFYSKGGEFELVKVIDLAIQNYQRHGFHKEHATFAAKYMSALTTRELLKGEEVPADVVATLESNIASGEKILRNYAFISLEDCRKHAEKKAMPIVKSQSSGCLGISLVMTLVLLGAYSLRFVLK